MSFNPFIICLYVLKVCWLSFTLIRQYNFSPANIHWVLRFFIQSMIDFSYKATLSCHFFSWIDWKSPLVFITPLHNKQNCSFPEKNGTLLTWYDLDVLTVTWRNLNLKYSIQKVISLDILSSSKVHQLPINHS